MATEKDLYDLLRSILQGSKAIQGRFFLLQTSNGQDLNNGAWQEMEQDLFTDYRISKKYPCCVLLPPTELMKPDDTGWTTLRCDFFFLTPDRRTGDNDMADPDLMAVMSRRNAVDDWTWMRTCANEFKRKFRAATTALPPTPSPVTQPPTNPLGTNPTAPNPPGTNPNTIRHITEGTHAPDVYRRLSLKGSDRVNGIQLTTEIRLWTNTCDYTDYVTE